MRRLSALGLELQGISKIYYKGSKRIYKGLGVWGFRASGLGFTGFWARYIKSFTRGGGGFGDFGLGAEASGLRALKA